MTVEAVNQFLQKVSEDDKLQQELANILESKANDREAAAELGAKYDFQFTADELWQEVQNRQGEFQQRVDAGELNEEELEAVAGGAFTAIAGSIAASLGFAGTVIAKAKW